MQQPRRIGNEETAEWRELHDFYLSLKQREQRTQRRALKVALFCVPVLVGLVSLIQ
jgi:hypothetical protein